MRIICYVLYIYSYKQLHVHISMCDLHVSTGNCVLFCVLLHGLVRVVLL